MISHLLTWKKTGLNGYAYEFFVDHNIIDTTILVIIFWDFLMFYQMFLSPQMKRIVIISNKHGINELSHELANDLRLMILGN